MTSIVERAKSLMQEIEADYQKLTEGGNQTAGRRVRKNALELGRLTKELRAEVQDTRNALKEAKE